MNKPDLSQFASILNQGFHLGRLLQLMSEQAQPLIAGGAVRDFLLGRPFSDLDISTSNDPTPVARKFARAINGKWFWLDRERRQSRVLLKEGGGERCFDFTPWRASSLAGDLRCRDFTVNAIGVLPESSGELTLLDVMGGVEDLAARQLRLCSKSALNDDPLRILRGLRLAAQLGLSLPPDLLDTMNQQVPSLNQCAGERLAQELQQLFAAGPQLDNLRQLWHSGVLSELGLVVDGPLLVSLAEEWHCWDDRIASLTTNRRHYFEIPVTGMECLPGLLKFFRLLEQGCNPGQERLLLSRLRSSRAKLRLAEYCRQIFTGGFDWPGNWPQRQRARLRRLEQLVPHQEAVLATLWLVRGRSTAEFSVVEELLELSSSHLANGRLQDLLSGRELLELFNLKPGITVGRWQKLLQQEEYFGRINSREEALEYLTKREDKEIDKPIP